MVSIPDQNVEGFLSSAIGEAASGSRWVQRLEAELLRRVLTPVEPPVGRLALREDFHVGDWQVLETLTLVYAQTWQCCEVSL